MEDNDSLEYDFLLWFFENADFGPADCDVRNIMYEQYEKETGKIPPKTLTE